MRQILKKIVARQLQKYAKKLLDTHKSRVIAITGSVGKTSTKLAVAHLLKNSSRVLYHKGNFNTEFGLPLSLFNLESPLEVTDVRAWLNVFGQMRRSIKADYPYDVVVLEMGADQPGDIKRFTSYIKPDIGIVTAVAKVHLEEFRTVEAILEEKWHLAEASEKVLINAQDARLYKKALEARPDAIFYGLDTGDYNFKEKTFMDENGFKGTLTFRGERAEVILPVVARQSLYPLVAAAGIAHLLGINTGDIVRELASWEQPNGRMNVLAGKKGTTIIDDSYNSSPYAAVAALDTLYQFESGRRIAILGSMNELGEYEEKGHRLVGGECGDLDMLVTIGRAANEHLSKAAISAGLSKDEIRKFDNPYDAGDFVAAQLQKGDIILAKGSQNGVFAEEALKPLLVDRTDEQKLVRQSPKWLSIKQEQFK